MQDFVTDLFANKKWTKAYFSHYKINWTADERISLLTIPLFSIFLYCFAPSELHSSAFQAKAQKGRLVSAAVQCSGLGRTPTHLSAMDNLESLGWEGPSLPPAHGPAATSLCAML